MFLRINQSKTQLSVKHSDNVGKTEAEARRSQVQDPPATATQIQSVRHQRKRCRSAVVYLLRKDMAQDLIPSKQQGKTWVTPN